MKVLHVTSGNLYGGIETMLVTIARYRDAAPDMESQFAVCFDGRLRTELEATGVRVHTLGPVRARNPFSVRRARQVLRATIERDSIDVVVCHSSWPQAIFGPVVKALGRPLVLWQHGAADEGSGWLERWARKSRPGLVICNSKYTAASVRSASGWNSIVVIYCPVQPNAQPEDVRSRRSSLRIELNAGLSDVVIVQVSRLEPWKGHRHHLEALSRLKNLPGWVCWMVGGAQRPAEQEYLQELERLATELGIRDRVWFLGQRTDIPAVLSAADIHCQPNEGPEPFGITFVEALYAGLPVVSVAFGGALEIVDVSCGRLARPGDVDELAAHLRRLIEDSVLRQSLGNAGPSRAASLCDPAQQIQLISHALRRFGISELATAGRVQP